MSLLNQIEHYLFLYKGVDWLIAATVFAGIFLLGDKKRLGFALGIISSALGLLFSWQIASVANGISSFVLLILYLRGYLKWQKPEVVVEAEKKFL